MSVVTEPPAEKQRERRVRSILDAVRAGTRMSGPNELSGFGMNPEERPPPPRWAERVELGVTGLFFVLMFVTLLVGVFWRYVLNEPLVWTVNVGAICFLWVTLVGSGLPNWDDSHIQFDLVYEKLPAGGKRWARIAGNLLIVVTFGMAIPGTIDYLRFLHTDKVTGLDLTFDLAFGAVGIFFIATVLHRGRLLLIDLRSLQGKARKQHPVSERAAP
jgi:C4-dicarboxylate transporter, DctQ subunit